MGSGTANEEASILALHALAWTLEDQARAERLLALTGLGVSELRMAAGDPATLGAVLDFLAAHEPDLVACADAIGSTPAALMRARADLEA